MLTNLLLFDVGLINIIIWSGVEVNTGLICISAPIVRPLIQRYRPTFFTSPNHDTERLGYHGSSTR